MLVALQNFVKEKRKAAGKPYEKIGSGCSEDCLNCGEKGCEKRFYDTKASSVSDKAKEAAASGTAEKTEIVSKAEEDSFERNDQSKEQKSIYAEFVEEERKKAMEEQKQDPSEFEYVKLEEEEE